MNDTNIRCIWCHNRRTLQARTREILSCLLSSPRCEDWSMRGTRTRLAAAKTGGERFYIISILHIPSTKGDISPCARLTNCKYHIREGVLSDQAKLLAADVYQVSAPSYSSETEEARMEKRKCWEFFLEKIIFCVCRSPAGWLIQMAGLASPLSYFAKSILYQM